MRSLWGASGSGLEARSPNRAVSEPLGSLGARCGGARLTAGPASDDALDDPPLQPLHRLDLEPDACEVIQGISHEVVGGDADAERVEHSLHGAYGKRCAAHVFEQHQPPAGAQDAMRLGHGSAVVRDRAQAERDDHGVEAVVLELQGLGVADPQVDVAPELLARLVAISSIWGLSSIPVRRTWAE
jgi:hypothetical protein